MKNKTQKGFTLLELLVVMGIIGLLASILVVNLTSARRRARDTKRITDIRGIQTSLEDYFGKNGKYPQYIGTLVTDGYLPLRPLDPLAVGGVTCAVAGNANSDDCYFYAYYPATNPYSYHVGTSLEDTGSALLNQDRDCNSTSATNNGCPVSNAAYTNGFSGADSAGCTPPGTGSGSTNRYCYDLAQ